MVNMSANIDQSFLQNPSPNPCFVTAMAQPNANQPKRATKTDASFGWKGRIVNAAKKICPLVPKAMLPSDPLPSSVLSLHASPSSPPVSSLAASTTFSETDHMNNELWWGPTGEIDEGLICRLTKRLIGNRYGDRCWVQEKHVGTYNRVYIVMFDDYANGVKVALKVPAAGWAPRWSPGDVIYLRSEALTLRYIHQKCDDVPFIPQLLAYDTTFNNEISAPFLLMTHLKGRPAHHLWGFIDDPNRLEWPQHESERRSNLHSSLAKAMSKLKCVEFNAIGLPDYLDDECNGPYIRAEFERNVIDEDEEEAAGEKKVPYIRREWIEVPTFSRTKNFFEHWIDKGINRVDVASTKEHGSSDENLGLSNFLSLLPSYIPSSRPGFSERQPETFSLAHSDLDWQNILCDDQGNVTGIVDWEGVVARPHHLGWAALPLWLRKDWDSRYNWPWNRSSLTLCPSDIQWYRREYVSKLNELEPWRGSTKGPIHPSISHLTCSLYDACRDPDGDLGLWCDRFLHMTIPSFRKDFLRRLGRNGWIVLPSVFAGEEMSLKKWLEDYYLRYYLSYGCSSAELTELEAPKHAADCICFSEHDDSDSDSDIFTEDGSKHDTQSVIVASGSRPGTPCTIITVSPSSSPGGSKVERTAQEPGTLCTKFNMDSPTSPRSEKVEKIDEGVSVNPVADTQDFHKELLAPEITYISKEFVTLKPATFDAIGQRSAAPGPAESGTSIPEFTALEPSSPALMVFASTLVSPEHSVVELSSPEPCTVATTDKPAREIMRKLKAKLGDAPRKMFSCGRKLKNLVVGGFRRD